MTQANTHRRARLDALLDRGGLEQASAADQAWLAAERGRDPSFDHEVAALLRAEAHLRDWGTRASGTGQTADEALEGILAGLDAGLYDDDLDLDGPPRFADGDGEVVALGARPVAVASDAVGAAAVAAAAGTAPTQPRSLGSRVVRDGRVMQVLAAAAALVLVVTAGVSMVSVSSSPEASESAVAVQAPSPAPGAAVAPPVVAPAMEAPAEASRYAEAAPMAEAEFYDEQQAPQEPAAPAAAPRDGRVAQTGGYGGQGTLDQLSASRPSGSATGASAGGVPAGATARTQSAAPAAVELMAQPEAPPAPVSPSFASDVPSSEDAMTRGVARRPGSSSSADDIRPAPRYTTQSAMQQAMNQCITAQRVVTYQVAARTGVVQVLGAPGASETELSCLRGVAARTTVTPAPGVARRQQVTLRTVPDRSAQ